MDGGFHYEPGFIAAKPCATNVYIDTKNLMFYDNFKDPNSDMYRKNAWSYNII